MFVFFSDGILDARNRNGELFGRGRVEKIVLECAGKSADCVVDSLFQAVAEHSAGMETCGGGDPRQDWDLRHAVRNGSLALST